MHQYDVVLKILLQQSLHRITGSTITRWLPTELPKVQNLRIDLLGETSGGELIQIEVQSTNDPGIPFRMLEYLVVITRLHGRVPKQIVLYVGKQPLQMASEFKWADGEARFTLIDMLTLNGEALLASPEPSDNVLGVLTRLEDHRTALRRILESLSKLQRDQADFYYRALLILAGLRGLEKVVQEEAKIMLAIDISENKVLGPAYKRAVEEGHEKGLQEGLQEGRKEGLHEGQVILLRQLIEHKFGALPSWAEQRLLQSSGPELEQFGLSVLDAHTLEDLLR